MDIIRVKRRRRCEVSARLLSPHSALSGIRARAWDNVITELDAHLLRFGYLSGFDCDVDRLILLLLVAPTSICVLIPPSRPAPLTPCQPTVAPIFASCPTVPFLVTCIIFQNQHQHQHQHLIKIVISQHQTITH